ncbi:MAG: hypothetical protein ACK5PP_17340 [Acidimicrobiales bacterium]
MNERESALDDVAASSGEVDGAGRTPGDGEGHFKPVGTLFLLGCFVVVLVLLWLSVYLILISRGTTV